MTYFLGSLGMAAFALQEATEDPFETRSRAGSELDALIKK
jgi:hypothetical protein